MLRIRRLSDPAFWLSSALSGGVGAALFWLLVRSGLAERAQADLSLQLACASVFLGLVWAALTGTQLTRLKTRLQRTAPEGESPRAQMAELLSLVSATDALEPGKDNLKFLTQQMRLRHQKGQQAMEELAGVVEETEGQLIRLSVRVCEDSETIQEMVSHLEEIKSFVEATASSSQQARSGVEAGLRESEHALQVIEESFQAMFEIMQNSDIIEELAYQSNILGVNAAIEAARAGKEGLGFAVVASEMQNLAEQSRSAAKTIRALSDSSRKTVESSNHSLKLLVAAIEQSVKSTSEVALHCEQQAAQLEELRTLAGTIEESTQQSASHMEGMAMSSNQFSSKLEELRQHLGLSEERSHAPLIWRT